MTYLRSLRIRIGFESGRLGPESVLSHVLNKYLLNVILIRRNTQELNSEGKKDASSNHSQISIDR